MLSISNHLPPKNFCCKIQYSQLLLHLSQKPYLLDSYNPCNILMELGNFERLDSLLILATLS